MDHGSSTTHLAKPQSQSAILLAEIGVWLHLLGKFSAQFIHDQLAGQGKHYKEFYRSLARPLRDVYTNDWLPPFFPKLSGVQWPTNLAQFSTQHDNPRFANGQAVISLVADAHGRGSGTEKGLFDQHTRNPIVSSQTHLDSVFGYSLTVVDLAQLDVTRDALYDFLELSLTRLKQDLENKRAIEWVAFRREFINHLQRDFSATVGDTRRPINDISLWDQTAATVTFFKPALAHNFLIRTWRNPIDHKYTWQLLRVGFDGPAFWSQAHRVPDLIARRELLSTTLDRVRDLLEVTFPLSLEAYRDENGSVFLLPDLPNILHVENQDGRTLREQIVAEVKQVLGGEITPVLQQDVQSSRTLYPFGRLVGNPLPPPTADLEAVAAWWSTDRQEVCIVCGLRPQGFGARMVSEYRGDPDRYRRKAEDRNVCCVCLHRMKGRAEDWARHRLDKNTIWIDEVADTQAKVALIVGRFDLTHWFTGEHVSSVLTVDPADVSNRCYTDIVAELQKTGPETPLGSLTALSSLLDQHVQSELKKVSGLWDFQIEDTDLARFKGVLPDYELLALALMRKTPSFARIRRVWETTRAFWQQVQAALPATVGTVGPRLAITGALQPRTPGDMPGDYHAYELALPAGIRLSVVWDTANRRFITCDNLDYLARSEQLGRPVGKVLAAGQTLTIEEPTGYGAKNQDWGEITVESVRELNDEYTPAIPILAEPCTFMALVPADRALAVAQDIRQKYEREMARVRNRLLLHLGVIYAPRRTPLRAVLDAGRRMLESGQAAGGTWQVTETPTQRSAPLPADVAYLAAGTQQFAAWYAAHLEQDGRRLTWLVPAVMGDGQTEDAWYPYVFLETGGDDTKVAVRHRAFKGTRPASNGSQPCWLVHVADLQEGDQVYFTPATFDFEFLDTSSRRFEIAYDETGRRRGRPARPYLLEELATLDTAWEVVAGPNGLTNSQIHALRDLIERKREEWRPTTADCASGAGMFWQFCRDAILTAQWPKGCRPAGDALQRLTDWAARGLLADVIELHMGIMQESTHRSTKQEETLP